MAEVAPETAHPAGARAGVATASADAPAGASANPWTLAEPRSPYAPPTAPVEHATDVYLDGHVVHAGFWKRVAAYLIDSVIIGVLSVVVGGAIGGVIGVAFGVGGGFDGGSAIAIQLVAQLASLLPPACYYGWFSASIGRAACRERGWPYG